MLYFANPTGEPKVHAAMAAGEVAFIDTPHQGNHRPAGMVWCADNGCYGNAKTEAKQFSEAVWWQWLVDNAADAGACAFATAPDVVGDAAATLARSRPWLPRIQALGYRAAFCVQDGSDVFPPPWGEFDVLFIGGTTEFKLGAVARRLVDEAKDRGMWVHMGRVNGGRRWRYADAIGCDSVDGTYLKHGPSVLLPNILRWRRQPSLFGEAM
jgi:hypothetical protein